MCPLHGRRAQSGSRDLPGDTDKPSMGSGRGLRYAPTRSGKNSSGSRLRNPDASGLRRRCRCHDDCHVFRDEPDIRRGGMAMEAFCECRFDPSVSIASFGASQRTGAAGFEPGCSRRHGRTLATTTYALIASVQLLVLYAF